MEKRSVSLSEVKRRMEKFFAPDINFTWDDAFKMYRIHAVTESGKAWLHRYNAFQTGTQVKVKLIVEADLEYAMRSAGLCGLVVESVLKPDDDDQST